MYRISDGDSGAVAGSVLFLVGFVRPGHFGFHLSPRMMDNKSDRCCLELLWGEFLYSGLLGQPLLMAASLICVAT